MGVTFHLQGVETHADGHLRLLEDAELKCSDRLHQLLPLLDRIDGYSRQRAARIFPWYVGAFDWDSGRAPAVADCAHPKDILSATHSLERELQRNPKRHPSDWNFWLRRPDGIEEAHHTLTGHYQGKHCRLFADEGGAWAVETASPAAYPVHYPLSDLSEVSVAVEEHAPPVAIRIERIWPLAAHQQLFEGMKHVSLLALQREILLLPYQA